MREFGGWRRGKSLVAPAFNHGIFPVMGGGGHTRLVCVVVCIANHVELSECRRGVTDIL